ncbi:hypothetical protein E4U55_000461 [Claviceps digitariae]|nr:hypothetical protein E4U55_000461 [Claviceps digitariae]
MAAPPQIPDPLDDEEELIDEFDLTPAAAKESASAEQDKEQSEAEEAAPPARPIRQPCPRPRLKNSSLYIPSNLDKLSAEIRYMIYEEILTVRQPINVHSGWQQVYKRQRLCIPIGILCTCKRFYREAIKVLYGSNTFLYRLRDKIPSMTDVDLVAHIDEDDAMLPTTTKDDNEAGDEDEDPEPDDVNDPDWQEDFSTTARADNARRTRARNRAPVVQPDIHVQKHMHLFRRLVIEAEKNRFAQGTKKLMANAIQTFAFTPSSSYSSRKHAAASATNIKTLTIRVSPQWDATAGPDGYGRFTFVDFFTADSAVVRAIENINCQFLQLDLMTGYMDGSLAHSGRRFTMDMRYMRLVRRVRDEGHDEWAHDRAAQLERQRKAAVVAGALRSLDGQVREFCETFLRHEAWDADGWDVIPFGAAGGDDDDDYEDDGA